MNLHILSKVQITEIYHNYMVHDFPQEELKPLAVILDLLNRNLYFAYGLYDQDKLLAYMYFCKSEEFTLLDYFAVVPSCRCLGYGSKCLELLFEKEQETGPLLLEVENPAFSSDLKDTTVRQRRIQFYLNSGVQMTDIQVNLFGTRMVIMYKPLGSLTYAKPQLLSALKKIYQNLFTPEQLETKVTIYP